CKLSDLTFRLLVAIGGVFLLYATYHMGGSFFFATPFFCGLHPQKLHLSPPKAPPFTPKSSTFHPQKLHLSCQNIFKIMVLQDLKRF
ncbi:hypothetical protein, partial [Escherichia coli]